MSIELVMLSNHFILCLLFLLLPSIFPSIRVFSNESALLIRWPMYWNFSSSPSNEYSVLISFRIDWFDLLAVQGIFSSFSSSPSNEYSVLISFRIDWFDLLAVQGIFSSTSVWKRQFFSAQPSLWSSFHIHTWLLEKPFIWMTNIWTFVSKVMSLLFNIREVVMFRPGSSRFWFR